MTSSASPGTLEPRAADDADAGLVPATADQATFEPDEEDEDDDDDEPDDDGEDEDEPTPAPRPSCRRLSAGRLRRRRGSALPSDDP